MKSSCSVLPNSKIVNLDILKLGFPDWLGKPYRRSLFSLIVGIELPLGVRYPTTIGTADLRL
jgi:hypothetical protein